MTWQPQWQEILCSNQLKVILSVQLVMPIIWRGTICTKISNKIGGFKVARPLVLTVQWQNIMQNIIGAQKMTKVGHYFMHHTQVMRAQLPNRAHCVGGTLMISFSMCIGLGFDWTRNGVVQYLCSSEGSNDGGILFWSDTMKNTASRASFVDSAKLEDKQLHCIEYLCELVYDLLIAPIHNVSRSPGFELWLGSLK